MQARLAGSPVSDGVCQVAHSARLVQLTLYFGGRTSELLWKVLLPNET
jgi:hypothetical protein